MKRGGYLKFYGLWEWYDVQPKEVQEYLYKSCGYGINSDSRMLIEGEVEVLTCPDDLYPPSATTFLCNHALNALRDRSPKITQTLMAGAFNHAKSPEDAFYYCHISLHIAKDLHIYPDQDEINQYKPNILCLIRDNPGILQMDVKNHFPAKDNNLVGYALSQLKYEKAIRREKKGRSFQLWVAT